MTRTPPPAAKLIYTARIHASGGRERGNARSRDGRLNLQFSVPGGSGTGTNPEQLFAAGWAACFESAMAVVAQQKKIPLPADLAIDAEVDLNIATGGDYFLRARLYVSVPGVERSIAQGLVDAAHQICPYSKATRGNLDVTIDLV